ncbi:hypothetical protein HDU87_002654 [Geranomyces variabilis]|uniref:F-box protein Hrt3/FBXO9 C-terminal domain-containing protein n=1 Tax=Geranomyces variabilis TaxID=109894 RepID=A0AAD5XQW2_9FUNG|nr:hypothetical protein HDU87_002654 [Geranomyces variabilis]
MDIEHIPVGEAELSSFRQTWKAEVSAQHKAVPTGDTGGSKSGTPASSATSSALASPRKPLARKQDVAPPLVAGPSAVPPAKVVKPASTVNDANALMAPSKPPDTHTRDENPAISAYSAGTRYERMGNLAEALKFYREAHRLDPDVEKKFRELPPRPLADDPSANLFTYYDLAAPTIIPGAAHTATSNSAGDDDSLVAQFRALNVGFSPLRPARKSKFFLLPNELISQIIVWAILLQGQSAICPMSLVSKKMFVLCAEQCVWRAVCERVHRPQQADQDSHRRQYSFQDDSIDSPATPPPLPPLSLELPLYNNSWAEMWRLRPRIRRDGVFISRINYVRQGQAIESYYAPVHLVSYFRYVRFFTDDEPNNNSITNIPVHRVAFWTTTLEPAAAVKLLGAKDFRQKGLMLGTYELDGRRVNLDLTAHDHRGGGVRFCAELDVVQSRKGRMNKLVWAGYWQQKANGQRSDIPLATLRPFMFSKVNSFPRTLL